MPFPRPFARTLVPALLAAATLSAAAGKPDDPRALVDSVADTYVRLQRYRFEGQMHAEATGAGLPQAQSLDVPFRYAAVRPSRLHNESLNPFLPTVMVADGESLWVSAASIRQYVRQPAPVLKPGQAPDSAARAVDPMLALAHGLAEHLVSARALGTDTVRTTRGVVACRRIELAYDGTGDRPGMQSLPRVIWVDPARRVVLRDSNTTRITHPQYGEVLQVEDVRYVVADVASAGPDSLFRFTPPEGSRRVRRLSPQSANDPDDAGKVAGAFSLAVLDGGGRRVSLADHQGQVVVLDFWATWCGPCRRWMPIVAKLERELAGKGVAFYAVNAHEPEATVRKYVKDQKVEVPVLLDADGAVGTAYGARSIPLTVVVGRDGRIVRTLLGLHPEEDLRDALAEAGVEGL